MTKEDFKKIQWEKTKPADISLKKHNTYYPNKERRYNGVSGVEELYNKLLLSPEKCYKKWARIYE